MGVSAFVAACSSFSLGEGTVTQGEVVSDGGHDDSASVGPGDGQDSSAATEAGSKETGSSPKDAPTSCGPQQIVCDGKCIECVVPAGITDGPWRQAACVNSACAIQCVPGAVECSNRCTDLGTSAANCGACGRSCANFTGSVAGVCAARECVPEERVSSLTTSTPRAVVDGATIVFQDRDTLYKCTGSTCPSPTPLYSDTTVSTSGGDPMVMAGPGVGSSLKPYVYFVAYFKALDSKRIARCNVSGCAMVSSYINRVPTALAGDTTSLFVAEGKAVYAGSHSTSALTLMTTANSIVTSMATSSTHLYYYDSGVGIQRCPRTGTCTPTTVVSLTDNGTHPFAVVADKLYWAANSTTTTIYTCDPSNCASPVALSTAQPYVSAITADSRGAYWGGKDLFGCFKPGGCSASDVHLFKTPAAGFDAMVLGMNTVDTDLVWTYVNNGVGSVRRVAARP